jgi:IS605 OrfB family transposase
MARPPADIGVDFGVVNIATDSNGKSYTGEAIENVRTHLLRRRAGFQRRGTRRQRRFQTRSNPMASKDIVETAQRPGRTIGLEDRLKARRQRGRLHNWSFGQLRLVYKKRLAGLPVLYVDPSDTSRACSCRGCIDDCNRPAQATFSSISCGLSEPADLNAARKMRARATIAAPVLGRLRSLWKSSGHQAGDRLGSAPNRARLFRCVAVR